MLAGDKKDSDSDGEFGGYGGNQQDMDYNDTVGVDPYHEEDEVDEKGFEKRIEGDDDIFVFKNIVLPGIPATEKIKRFVVSEETKILISENNKIYRWRIKNDAEFRAYELPELQK